MLAFGEPNVEKSIGLESKIKSSCKITRLHSSSYIYEMGTKRIAGPSGMMIASDLQGLDLSWALQQWILPVVAAAVTVVLLARRYGHQERLQLPPEPRNWPAIGAVLSMEPILHEEAFEKLAAK